MNFFKINLNIKNFTYGWFIFSILIIILLASLQAYFEYKRAIENTKISTSNVTMLLSKKFENDFEQAENILKLAEYFVLTLPKENNNFYGMWMTVLLTTIIEQFLQFVHLVYLLLAHRLTQRITLSTGKSRKLT